eukprot:TRINITY_DN6180_c0_g1_i4.p1 TRINITY_DN6180_c0_g1~~TRINITY_DN6180_c0_g1_i4.p1  ORF type:complete len:251 (-),score=66.59 TRINITY_DN6180_c0_g1_i4:261-950(-)
MSEDGTEVPQIEEELAQETKTETLPKPAREPPKPKPKEDWLREGHEQKEKGKKAYSEGRYSEAIDSWCMSRGTFKHIRDRKMYEGDEEKENEVRQTLLSIHLNLAQGSLKTGEFYQATDHCGRALEIDPKNTKALYRKAAGFNMGDMFDDARQTLNELLELEPGNAAALQMMQDIDRKSKLALRSAKKASQKMLSQIDHDPRAEPEQDSDWLSWLLSCSFCKRRREKPE